MRRLSLLLALSATLGLAVPATHAAQKMYFLQTQVDTTFMLRANLDGSNLETVVPGTIGGPISVAVDQKAGWVYYGEASAGFIGLARAKLDGTDFEQLVEGVNAASVAIAGSGGKIYWSNFSGIFRADPDGGNVEQVLSGLSGAEGLSIDLPGGRLFWTEDSPARVRRANLDGSGLTDLYTDTGTFGETVLVPAVEKIYWLQNLPVGGLWRANLDGTDAELLPTVLSNPTGVDVNLVNNQLYLIDTETTPPFESVILRVTLAGRVLQTVLTGLLVAGDLDLDDRLSGEPVPANGPVGAAILILIVLGASFRILRR